MLPMSESLQSREPALHIYLHMWLGINTNMNMLTIYIFQSSTHR